MEPQGGNALWQSAMPSPDLPLNNTCFIMNCNSKEISSGPPRADDLYRPKLNHQPAALITLTVLDRAPRLSAIITNTVILWCMRLLQGMMRCQTKKNDDLYFQKIIFVTRVLMDMKLSFFLTPHGVVITVIISDSVPNALTATPQSPLATRSSGCPPPTMARRSASLRLSHTTLQCPRAPPRPNRTASHC